jgi:ATP-dependent RNA helicase RhlE
MQTEGGESEEQADAGTADAKAEKSGRSRSRTRGSQRKSADKPAVEPVAAAERDTRRRSSDRPSGGGATVVGMGDHLPSFIALSFEERRAD